MLERNSQGSAGPVTKLIKLNLETCKAKIIDHTQVQISKDVLSLVTSPTNQIIIMEDFRKILLMQINGDGTLQQNGEKVLSRKGINSRGIYSILHPKLTYLICADCDEQQHHSFLKVWHNHNVNRGLRGFVGQPKTIVSEDKESIGHINNVVLHSDLDKVFFVSDAAFDSSRNSKVMIPQSSIIWADVKGSNQQGLFYALEKDKYFDKLSISKDNSTLFAAWNFKAVADLPENKRHSIGVWDLTKNHEKGEEPLILDCDSPIESLNPNPNGTLLVVASRKRIDIWDVKQKMKKEVYRFNKEELNERGKSTLFFENSAGHMILSTLIGHKLKIFV